MKYILTDLGETGKNTDIFVLPDNQEELPSWFFRDSPAQDTVYPEHFEKNLEARERLMSDA